MDVDTQLTYGVFWSLYAAAFLLFFVMMSKLFRVIPLYGLRTLLQALLVVLLLTPVESREAMSWWVPAWLHGGYEFIRGELDEAARAGFNLFLAGLAMLLVWVLDLVRYRIAKS